MSTPDRPNPSSANAPEIDVTPGFEEKLNQFWTRHRTSMIALFVVILLVIVGRGAWDYMAEQKAEAVQSDYAAAGTTDQLKAFATANEGTDLAALAWLQVADAAYSDEQGSAAVEAYGKAKSGLGAGALADRASLGLAMSQLMAKQNSDGEASLKTLVDDSSVTNGVRSEAAYQLASLAHTANDDASVKKYSDEIMQIDPSSVWAQRVMALRSADATVEQTAAKTPDATQSDGKSDSVIKLNLSDSK